MVSSKLSGFQIPLQIAAAIVTISIGSIALFKGCKKDAIVDLAGKWIITSNVQSASDEKNIGDEYVYEVYVVDTESKLSGIGEQTKYNKSEAKSHFKVVVDHITMVDDTIRVVYTVGGSRDFRGDMKLLRSEGNDRKLVGTFRQTTEDIAGSCVVVID